MIDIHYLLKYLDGKGIDVTIDLLNAWYKAYYEEYGKRPRFNKGALAFIKERFS